MKLATAAKAAPDVSKKKILIAAKKKKPKLSLVAKKKTHKKLVKGKTTSNRGGARERSGRFSLFRPKVRGRAYPVQDNEAGWKLFQRITKQSGLSGSDVYTLGFRYLIREHPELTKESAIKIAANLAEHDFFGKK